MNTPLRRSGTACVLKGFHSFTCTPRVPPLTERTIPAFSLPAKADPEDKQLYLDLLFTVHFMLDMSYNITILIAKHATKLTE